MSLDTPCRSIEVGQFFMLVDITYIIPIVDHVLRNGSGKGIQEIVVYQMNALANCRPEELCKFLEADFGPYGSPVTLASYTG